MMFTFVLPNPLTSMPTDYDIKALALLKGAQVTTYNQHDRGYCAALVSTWIRKRLQGKNTWEAKHFSEADDPDRTHIPGGRGDTETGLSRQRDLQLLLEIGGLKTHATQNYIVFGLRGDKKGKELKAPVGSMLWKSFNELVYTAIGNIDNIDFMFKQIQQERAIAYFAFDSINQGRGHIVGFDCLDNLINWFDPNIGEFTFANMEKFMDWWEHCFTNRNIYPGAFRILKEKFDVALFTRNVKDDDKKFVLAHNQELKKEQSKAASPEQRR